MKYENEEEFTDVWVRNQDVEQEEESQDERAKSRGGYEETKEG